MPIHLPERPYRRSMYYCYFWLREDGTPYYVGKGSWKRVTHPHRGNRWKHPPKIRIIYQGYENEEDAFIAEKFFISFYGRVDLGTGCLRNLTDGGEGSSGYKPTKETLEKLRISHLGHKAVQLPWTEERRLRASLSRKGKSNGCLGRKMSEFSKEKLRLSHIGKTASVETRAKMSRAQQGRVMSDKAIENMRAAQGSDAVRQRKSQSLSGKPWSFKRREKTTSHPKIGWYKAYSKWRVRDRQGKHVGYFVRREEAECVASSL